MKTRNIFLAVALVLCLTLNALAAEPPQAYVNSCSSCHGSNGSGRKTSALGQIPDLRSRKISSLTDDQLYDAIATGNRHQSYAHSFLRLGLSESDLRKIVRYIRDLQGNVRTN